ncbi:hypothetical protein BGX29_007879 [Mortierella sp. GBA35]|nr:hypothetical protein BGX29_007879 [Mortierella sp. GBA35]
MSIFDLPELANHTTDALRQLVRDDYLSAAQKDGDKPSSQITTTTTLSKYGHLIRRLVLNQRQLEDNAPRPTTTTDSASASAAATETEDPSVPVPVPMPEPTEHELLLHLLKCCPNLQSLKLDDWGVVDGTGKIAFWETIAKDVIPTLGNSASPSHVDPMAWTRMQLLPGEDGDGPKTEVDVLVGLTDLAVGSSYPDSLQALADLLRTGGLPELDDIRFNCIESGDGEGAALPELASLLSACHKGWRSVYMPALDTLSADALIQHCPTLESLNISNTPGLTSAYMRHILSSSPNLHTFVTLNDGQSDIPRTTHFLAADFIDIDPATNTLQPWLCVSKLKQFSAKIVGIPRPDVALSHYGRPRKESRDLHGNAVAVEVLQETHPGQGRELQRRVYERLSRFRHLEVLGLGHDDRDFGNEGRFVEDAEGLFIFGDKDYQYECLEMSLDSGLRMLEGMKRLQVLNVMRMSTLIDVEEMRWMAESWPRLKEIVGLNTEGNELETEKWLKENCPSIKSEPCTFYP